MAVGHTSPPVGTSLPLPGAACTASAAVAWEPKKNGPWPRVEWCSGMDDTLLGEAAAEGARLDSETPAAAAAVAAAAAGEMKRMAGNNRDGGAAGLGGGGLSRTTRSINRVERLSVVSILFLLGGVTNKKKRQTRR
jgi:hypothetical protein